MRRLAFSLLILMLLAACSSAPQRSTSRGSISVPVAGNAYRTAPPGFPHFVDHSVGREEISIQAMSLVGVPYRWGGNTPESGFDCSGFVRYVVERSASVNLPRTTADMSGRGESIDPDEVAPGDLIFFNTTGRAHSHVGIYVGKLRFVNAPSTGGTVRLDYLTNPYWAKRFDGIRRVAPPKATPFDTPTYDASVAPDKAVAPAAVAAVAAPAMAAAPMPRTAVIQTQQPLTASVAPPQPATAAAADPFEPPPPGMSAAQMQARAAGAVTPATVSATPAPSQPANVPAIATTSEPGSIATTRPSSPDPIDSAADAFEPPPPAAVAARQAQQARQEGDAEPVQIMRASTASRPQPAPTQTGDDPIARFANGSY